MLLKFLASRHAGWMAEAQADRFEMDHSIPFARMKKMAEKTRESYAVGSIANLALLPAKMNNQKRDKTLDEWLADSKNVKDLGVTNQQIWSLVPYSPDELKVPALGTDGVITAERFNELMLEIWNRMKDELILIAQGR
jgi:hypothetical protein